VQLTRVGFPGFCQLVEKRFFHGKTGMAKIIFASKYSFATEKKSKMSFCYTLNLKVHSFFPSQ